MKTHNEEMKISVLAMAIRCALIVTAALPTGVYAGEDDAESLKHPSNSIEFGSLYSSQTSARFGQYNGLNKEGFYGLGGFDVRGGDGYDSSKESAVRWKLNGENLGTTSRALGASISEQGKWKLSVGYDELQHNITDTYQTPLQGKTGGNDFTLPANFGAVSSTAPGTRGLNTTQLSDFHTEKEYVNRKNTSLSTSYMFNSQFSAQIDYNHLEQSGAKLISTGAQGGINVGTGIGGAGIKGTNEAVNIIMNPTSYSTDNINAALNWVGDKGHLTIGYYGSLFHDDYNSLSWQNAVITPGTGTCTNANCYTNNSMSTTPSNSLHQAHLSGGYNFSPVTKLVGGFSYGYNQQNASYAPTDIMQPTGSSSNMMRATLPTSSLNGLVETIHGDLKLTNQSIKDLNLSASFKFDERDNRTASAAYLYNGINSSGTGTGAFFTGINTPYSNRKMQYEAIADYRLAKGQNLNLTYGHESIKRWCNNGTQCVASPTSEEDKISLTYRLKAFDDVNFNAGYSYANRRADANNFLATGLTTASNFNAANYLGYVAYPYASRSQNLGKMGVNWQVTQNLDLGVNGRYSYDDYNATLGVQNGQSVAVNVDATYSYNENSSISAYWSWQNGQRNLRSGQNGTPNGGTTNIWTNKLNDNSNSVGLLAKHSGLLDGKLEIIGDMSYSLDTSRYSTEILYNPTATTCGGAGSLTCGSLSPIKNEIISLKLTGNYKVLENGKISLSYLYQKLNSNDYFYNGQQFGYTPNSLMPTGLQQQSYTNNVVALSYSHSF